MYAFEVESFVSISQMRSGSWEQATANGDNLLSADEFLIARLRRRAENGPSLERRGGALSPLPETVDKLLKGKAGGLIARSHNGGLVLFPRPHSIVGEGEGEGSDTRQVG